MSLNDYMNDYMPWNSCRYVRSIIFVNFGMMNIWDCWWTPTVNDELLMIWICYVEVLCWFLKKMMLYDYKCLKLMNRTCN